MNTNRRWSLGGAPASLSRDGRVAVRIEPKEEGEQAFLRIYETASERLLAEPLFLPMPKVQHLAVSPDGTRLAVGIHPQNFGEVRVFDLKNGDLVFRPIWLPNYPACVEFSPDGSILAIGGFDHTVRFWDLATGRECLPMIAADDIVSTLAFVPDQPGLIAVGCHPSNGQNGKTGSIQIWDYRLGRPRSGLLMHNTGPLAVHFVTGTNRIVVSDETGSRVHDTAAGILVGKPLVEEVCAALLPGKDEFLTGGADGFVRIRLTTTAAPLGTILETGSRVKSLAVHPDGTQVAAGSEDGTVQLADIEARQPLGPPLTMQAAVKEVRFSPDGRSIIAQDVQGHTRVWPAPQPLSTDNPDDLKLLVEARTGYQVEVDRSITPMPPADWKAKLEEVRRLGKTLPKRDDSPWVECRVREAEEGRHAFSAVALLHRRIEAEPGNPWLKARLARARGWLGEWEKASNEYRSLESSLSKDDLFRWQYHCAIEALDVQSWAEARWYLDRLISAWPGDPIVHDRRAIALENLGKVAEARADREAAIRLGPPPHLALSRSTELAQEGRWDQAATLLRDCAQLHCLSPFLLDQWAISSLRSGSPARFREFRRKVLDQLRDRTVNGVDVLQLVDSLGIREVDEETEAILLPLFRRIRPERRPPQDFEVGMAIRLNVRLGRDAEAVRLHETFRKTADEPISPDRLAALAIAYHRLGQTARALDLLKQAGQVRLPEQADVWTREGFRLEREAAQARILHDPGFPENPFEFENSRK